MQVDQSISFTNNIFAVECSVPTLANCQEFVNYWRKEYSEMANLNKENLSEMALFSMPTYETIFKRVELLRPFIKCLSQKDNEENETILKFDDISLLSGDLALFLSSVSMQLYSETFGLSTIKKK